ncbi:lantibiotic dehydratase [Kitasatospora phosalacinea]|uniref:lantibiotic dehydratase n=1 Tax=Kitasatospora phosalacinea TaxID=2065 RepID=UPI0036653EF5
MSLSPSYRAAAVALVRAVARPDLPVHALPDLTAGSRGSSGEQERWLREVWADGQLAEALELASPALARSVAELLAAERPAADRVRRAALSTARYVLRAQGRPTPFGLFAGVQAAAVGGAAWADWGTDDHRATRAPAARLVEEIDRLERCPQMLARLEVVANNTAQVRGDHLVVPHRHLPGPDGRAVPAEATLRRTGPVAFAMAAARQPLRFGELVDKTAAEFPTASVAQVTGLLRELVVQRALVSSLRAPATEPEPHAHLLRALERAGVDQVPEVTDTAGAVDLRLDADLVLPTRVAEDAARAAELLARLSPLPKGSAAWRAYHQRFYERYGRGALVPLLDVVADSGIGWPDGYPGARPAERARFDARDEALAALVQRAALSGEREVLLDERALDALGTPEGEIRFPPHLEVLARLHARSPRVLDRGEYRLEVTSVSRSAGVSVGRFLHLLEPAHRDAFLQLLVALPTTDEDTVSAQLSFPPLDPATGHVARSPATRQLVISLGEHRAPAEGVLGPEDLAVGCDGRRMYLAAPERGVRIEAAATHALNLRTHTPPLARLITELSRAHTAQTTRFSWGALAALSFLPQLRCDRIVLSPATWRITAAELPPANSPHQQWDQAFTAWAERHRAPRYATLAADSQGLPLDLRHPSHRVLLREHLRTAPHAVLVEAPEPADLGWTGGRAHEIVFPVTATRRPTLWPALPRPTSARRLRRGHGDAPGTSRVLLAALYGDVERQDTVLVRHLPQLLARLGQPKWWFVRFRDPRQQLRLRIALPDPAAFGPTAAAVSTWAGELHAAGLLSEVGYPTSYRERGRWGDGPVWDAAEEVFRADSAAALAHLSAPVRPGRHALLAAHTVAIAAAFTGSATGGLRWLAANVPATAPTSVPRPVFTEAVRLADPAEDFAALRAEPGGIAVADAWTAQHRALNAYRRHFPGPHTHGIRTDDVLGSLLHCSYVRAHRIDFDDEAIVLYLARAAALARLSRDGDR